MALDVFWVSVGVPCEMDRPGPKPKGEPPGLDPTRVWPESLVEPCSSGDPPHTAGTPGRGECEAGRTPTRAREAGMAPERHLARPGDAPGEHGADGATVQAEVAGHVPGDPPEDCTRRRWDAVRVRPKRFGPTPPTQESHATPPGRGASSAEAWPPLNLPGARTMPGGTVQAG